MKLIEIKLEPYEVQLAHDVAGRRFIENQKMGRSFGHGYQGTIERTLALGISGACAEVAFAKWKNVFWNGSYSDTYSTYNKPDIGKDIEIRSQFKKPNNVLIIRPNDKKCKYVLVVDENPTFKIMGWFPNFETPNEKYLTNFGIASRPYCYAIPLKDLHNEKDL